LTRYFLSKLYVRQARGVFICKWMSRLLGWPSLGSMGLCTWCVFSFTRFCSRMRMWPACIHPQRIISSESIVKRDKRTHDAGWSCGAFACVNMPTTSVSILESDEAHALYFTNVCLCHPATRRITAYDQQREILRIPNPRACAYPRETALWGNVFTFLITN
jgi:hypothetical protein